MRDKGHPPPPGTVPIDMLLYADDLESLATTRRGRIAIVLSYCYLTALGYPFKWSKTRKGYRVKWLGMETEYSSYRLASRRRGPSAIQGRQGPMTIPTMLKVLFSWLAVGGW